SPKYKPMTQVMNATLGTKKGKISMLIRKPQQFRVPVVPRDLLMSRLGGQDCFQNHDHIPTTTEIESKIVENVEAIVVSRSNFSVSKSTVATFPIKKYPGYRKKISSKQKKAKKQKDCKTNSSIDNATDTEFDQEKWEKVKQRYLQPSIFAKLPDEDEDLEARKRHFDEKIHGVKIFRMGAEEYKRKINESRQQLKSKKRKREIYTANLIQSWLKEAL
ncbi:hypothetical protein Ocin01_03568, partial [Orchesella cincta]